LELDQEGKSWREELWEDSPTGVEHLAMGRWQQKPEMNRFRWSACEARRKGRGAEERQEETYLELPIERNWRKWLKTSAHERLQDSIQGHLGSESEVGGHNGVPAVHHG